jgi:hypothetical protein
VSGRRTISGASGNGRRIVVKKLVAVFVALSTASVTSAQAAISLADFDAVSAERQARILGTVLSSYYKLYKSSATGGEVAACMERLYQPPPQGTIPRLVNLILFAVDVARSDKSRISGASGKAGG